MNRHRHLQQERRARAGDAAPSLWYSLTRGPQAPVEYAEALLTVLTSVIVSAVLRDLLPATSITFVFLLGVLAVAVRRGLGPSLVASVLSYGALRYFFGAPYFDFGVHDPETYVAVTMFLVVSLVVGTIAARLRDNLAIADERARRGALLYDLSRGLTAVATPVALARTVAECVEETAKRAALVLLRDGDGALHAPHDPMGRHAAFGPADHAAAAAALAEAEATGPGTERHAAAGWLFLPIAVSPLDRPRVAYGVLALRPRSHQDVVKEAEERRLLEAICDQAAVAVERVELAQAREQARVLAESERLRNTLLASVSHDLRTPLASIIGASSSLLELRVALDDGQRAELLETVLGEAERLDRCVQDLLDMSRLEHGALEPRPQWCDLRDTIGDALRHLKRSLVGHAVEVEVDAELPLLFVDPVLLAHILVNLIDNARKFSPPGAPIVVGAWRTETGALAIAVDDRGPGIPASDRERVFGMFERLEGGDNRVTGTGLGLAICQGFARALGATLAAVDRPGGRGSRMLLTLPAGPGPDLPLHEEA